MNNDHIQYRPKSRYYIPPLLLGHDYLKWMLLASVPAVMLIFLAGYILGFEKSNNKWISKLDPFELTLPNAGVAALVVAEPQPPEVEEPGASIDVDTADEKDSYVVVESTLEAVKTLSSAEESSPAVAKMEALTVEESNTEQDSNDQDSETTQADNEAGNDMDEEAMASVNISAVTESSRSLLAVISGLVVPEQNELEVEVLSKQDRETLDVLNDATKETARYSIQVGMYSDHEDADEKVEKLLKANLNAYLEDYKTLDDKDRYNVRFGYFRSFKSGQKALEIYKKIFGGFGYVARIKR